MNPLAVLGGVQALGGLVQGIIGSGKAKKAQRALENLQTPTTDENASINRLYDESLSSPYETSFYKNQRENIGRGTVQGLSALNDRRSGLMGISGLVRAQNDALLRAGAGAEQQQFQRRSYATGLKSRDDQRVWEINKLMPYQKQFSLLGAKADAANQMANAGFSNLIGGAQTAAMGFK